MSEPLAPLVGGVTGIGSVPGTDPREAAATVVGELEVPFLPELPNRGIGADMIGRGAGLLVDIGFDVSTTGYRIGVPGGRVARLAGDHLERDLDAFEEAYEVARRRGGGLVKTQVAGDRGAMRDVAASLTEGLVRHVADLRRRLGADVVLQLDEPSLWSVVHGTVPALTKLDPVRAVPAPEAAELLASLVDALHDAGAPVLVHLCGPIDWDVVRRVPVDGALLDATRLTAADYEGFGELAESRTVVGLGLAPAVAAPRRAAPQDLAAPALRLYDEVGLPRRDLARATVTPVCGSPGSPGIRPILDACKEIRSVLAEASVA